MLSRMARGWLKLAQAREWNRLSRGCGRSSQTTGNGRCSSTPPKARLIFCRPGLEGMDAQSASSKESTAREFVKVGRSKKEGAMWWWSRADKRGEQGGRKLAIDQTTQAFIHSSVPANPVSSASRFGSASRLPAWEMLGGVHIGRQTALPQEKAAYRWPQEKVSKHHDRDRRCPASSPRTTASILRLVRRIMLG